MRQKRGPMEKEWGKGLRMHEDLLWCRLSCSTCSKLFYKLSACFRLNWPILSYLHPT